MKLGRAWSVYQDQPIKEASLSSLQETVHNRLVFLRFLSNTILILVTVVFCGYKLKYVNLP